MNKKPSNCLRHLLRPSLQEVKNPKMPVQVKRRALQLNRAKNLNIMITKFKLKPENMVKTALGEGGDGDYDLEKWELLSKFTPPREQIEAMHAKMEEEKDYPASGAELYVNSLYPVQFPKEKFEAHVYRLGFDETLCMAMRNLEVFAKASTELANCPKMWTVLHTLKNLGNFMNKSFNQPPIIGFSLDNLDKLKLTRSNSWEGYSLYHHTIVTLEKCSPESLSFIEEIPNLRPAFDRDFKDAEKLVNELIDNVLKLEDELNSKHAASTSFVKFLTEFLNYAKSKSGSLLDTARTAKSDFDKCMKLYCYTPPVGIVDFSGIIKEFLKVIVTFVDDWNASLAFLAKKRDADQKKKDEEEKAARKAEEKLRKEREKAAAAGGDSSSSSESSPGLRRRVGTSTIKSSSSGLSSTPATARKSKAPSADDEESIVSSMLDSLMPTKKPAADGPLKSKRVGALVKRTVVKKDSKIHSQTALDHSRVGSPRAETLKVETLRDSKEKPLFKLSSDQFCDDNAPHIMELNFSGSVVLPVTPTHVAEYIKSNNSMQSDLTLLDLSAIQLNRSCLTILSEQLGCHKITNLSLAGNSLGNCVCDAVSISTLPFLEGLDLSENDITDEGIVPLMSSLNSNLLVTLLLRGNLITDTGAPMVASMLSRLNKLNKLDLSANKIGEGIQHIFKALLDYDHCLQCLNINGNPIDERMALEFFNMLECNSHLTVLSANCTGFSRHDKRLLSILNKNIVPDFTAMKFQTLHTIDLSVNSIAEFPYCLSDMHNLQNLNLSSMSLTDFNTSHKGKKRLENKITCITEKIAAFTQYAKLSTLDLEDLPSGLAALVKDKTAVNYSNNGLSEITKDASTPMELQLENAVSVHKPYLWVSFRVMLLGDDQEKKSALISALSAQPLHNSDIQFFTERYTLLPPPPTTIWAALTFLVTSTMNSSKPNDRVLFLITNPPEGDLDQRVNWNNEDLFLAGNGSPEISFQTEIKDYLYNSACRMQKVIPGLWSVLAKTMKQSYSGEIKLWRDFTHLARQLTADQNPTDLLKTLLPAVRFLHQVGELSYFADIKEWDIIFLNPLHLAAVLFAPLNASNKSCVAKFLLERELWRVFHHSMHLQFISLLVRFNAIIPIEIQGLIDPGPGFLVPSNMSENEPPEVARNISELLSTGYQRYCRVLLFDKIPSSFVAQIQASLLQLPNKRTAEYLWKRGAMVLTKSATAVEESSSTTEVIHIAVSRKGNSQVELKITAYEPTNTPTLLCLAMDAMTQTLTTMSPPLFPKHKILCLTCLQNAENHPSGEFDSGDIITTFSQGQQLVCPKCDSSFKPSALAPDLCAGIARKNELVCTDVEITKILGRGGYGTVFKAELKQDAGQTKTSAIKMWRNADITETLSEFRKEVEVMAQLPDNPHLVPLFGVCIQPVVMMVMEFEQFGDLRSLLSSSEVITDALVYHLALDIAKGLRALHSVPPKGFIHRDLRSPNVFLVSKDVHDPVCAKIGDYGLATRSRLTTAETLKTWRWLAPEVISENANYGVASDIYSFGMVLLELVNRPHEPFWELDENPKYSKSRPMVWFKTATKTYSEGDVKDATQDCNSYKPQLLHVDEELAQLKIQIKCVGKQLRSASTPELIENKTNLKGKLAVLKWKRKLLALIVSHAENVIEATKTAERIVSQEHEANEGLAKKDIIDGLRPEIPKNCPLALKTLMLNCWEQESLRPDAQVLIQLLTTAIRYQEEMDCPTSQIIDKYDLQVIVECNLESKIKTLCSAPSKKLVVLALEDGKILRSPSFPQAIIPQINLPDEVMQVASGGYLTTSKKILIRPAEKLAEITTPRTKTDKLICSAFVSGRFCIGTSTGKIYFLPENQVRAQCEYPQELTIDPDDNVTIEGFNSFIVSMCEVSFNNQQELWCCCDSSIIAGIDVVKKAVSRRISLGPSMMPVCILQCGNRVWVGTARNNLCVIDIETSEVRVLSTDGKVSRLAQMGGFIFAILQKSTFVHVWDPITLNWLCKIDLTGPTGKGTQGVLSSICIGLDKVWIGDNMGDIIGWDFSALMLELSSALTKIPQKEISEAPLPTKMDSSSTLKPGSRPEPLLQATVMPIPIAYGCMVQKSRSQQLQASMRASSLSQPALQLQPSPETCHGDIPLVGEIHFWAESSAPKKSGFLWAITTSGPRIVCCFKLILQQLDSAPATSASMEPIEFIFPPSPTELPTKSPNAGSVISWAIFGRQYLASGKLTLPTGPQVKCKLSQQRFTAKSSSGFKGLKIPTTDLVGFHTSPTALILEYKDSAGKHNAEFRLATPEQRTQWQTALEKAGIPQLP
ncbi:leucine-rich repeat serine/threonine-protein kinase 2 [Pelomyxa schiedti]|nr:leucine-rich repeat serine/threonine-protein kinase 2 [Pelomyxa schiedti]